ncbi:MAG: hypothetical protein IPI67_24175 [Myxococcales bacterium]|nr:hypothetical protein [Myxococcales bacterium]
MFKSNHGAALLFVATLSFACSDVMHEELHGDVSEARAELSRHHGLVIAATSLASVQADIAPHEQKLDAFLNRVGAGAKHCTELGEATMHNSMAIANEEIDAHTQTVLATDDVESARASCGQYLENMRHLLSAIDLSLTDMDCEVSE